MKIITATDDRNPRRRVRRVDERKLAAEALATAPNRPSRTAVLVEHGGTVANAYNYPAVTDAVVAVAFADLDVVVIWAGELRANKVTRGGVVANLLGPEARPLFDERYHPDKARAARQYVLELARDEIQ